MIVNFWYKKISVTPEKAYKIVQSTVCKSFDKKRLMDFDEFIDHMTLLGQEYIRRGKIALLVKHSDEFVSKLEKLEDKKAGDYICILYSTLHKLLGNVQNNILIHVLKKSLYYAKKQDDPVHIMARANSLRLLYKKYPQYSHRYSVMLHLEKKTLERICADYPQAELKYKTVNKKILPLENYKYMLALIKIEYSNNISKIKPERAKLEMLEALEIMQTCKSLKSKHVLDYNT